MKSIKQIGSFALTVSLLTSASAFAHTHATKANCDFLPKNNLKIPEGMELAGGLNKASFNKVIDKVESFYRPIIEKKGVKFVMNRLWNASDVVVHQDGSRENGDTVNANAEQSSNGKIWYVNMFGGLARHPVTTEDGFTLVLCHEIGHHLGGYPQIGVTEGNSDWASNEGQADYFATMKCFRRVYEKDTAENASVVSAMTVPAIVKTKCSDTFKSADEINLCIRESMGGNTLALLLWSLSNGDKKLTAAKKPDFSKPDKSKVSEIDDKHPAAQCRLDTYFNGSICGVSYSEEFGTKDASTGACAQEKGDKLGVRPLCWYKPQ